MLSHGEGGVNYFMSQLTDLEEYVQKEVRELEGILGLAIKHLETEDQVLFNADNIFPTASVFKIPVLIELYKQVGEEKLGLDDLIRITSYSKISGSGVLKELHSGLEATIHDLATLMIIVSDNTATDLLLDLVGMDNINQTLGEIGLTKTKVAMSTRDLIFDIAGLIDLEPEKKLIHVVKQQLQKREYNMAARSLGDEDNDVSTPFEMMLLLEKIFRNQILDQKACESMLDILKRCQYFNAIPLFLPEGKAIVAHKTGNLPGIRNDVGIIFPLDQDNNSPFIISAFTRRLNKGVEGDLAIARISKAAFDIFTSANYP
jgi:beta-lactamase class A